jgi:hypothetical protein
MTNPCDFMARASENLSLVPQFEDGDRWYCKRDRHVNHSSIKWHSFMSGLPENRKRVWSNSVSYGVVEGFCAIAVACVLGQRLKA